MFVERNDSASANPVGVECSGLRVDSTSRDFVTKIKYIFFFECHIELSKQLQILVFERSFAMMSILILHITDHRIERRTRI